MTERVDVDLTAPERAMLEQWLDYHRATLALKCDGLTDEQLRERAVPPSTMSLLGLIRHMADVERWWFARTIADLDEPGIYWTDDNENGDFDDVDTGVVADDFAAWRAECERAREIAADLDLDVTGSTPNRTVSLRWVYVHMIEEYARHNGHADMLREVIDGTTGD